MRRWMIPTFVFAVATALISPESSLPAAAQDKADLPVEETFVTADGVQLRGLFHKSTKDPSNAPVVIVVYPPGVDKDKKARDMTQGDWVGLANRLAKEGYHVFRFDWRGHGVQDKKDRGSDIKDPPKFWMNDFTGPWNMRHITGAGKRPLKGDLYLKDIKDPVRYAPTLLLDLAAVRAHLDSKNDAGELNMSSVFLIGSETAATLGMAWIATEWNRPAFAPTPNQLGFAPRYEFVPQKLNGGINTPAGDDISGAVWLSASRPSSMSDTAIKSWVSRHAQKLRDNNHMLFLHADKDAKAKKESDFFFNDVLVAKGNPKLGLVALSGAFQRDVKGANQLSGVALLGNNAVLKTEDTIVAFLGDIQKERAKITRKQRGFTAPWFINLSWFGLSP